MFWRFNYMTSDIDTLLDKEDVTLQEILNEDDVLQECKAQNKKLVDYLVRKDNIEELVNLVINEPSADVEERAKYKYANIACELLTSDVNLITETLATTESLLNKIVSFLDADSPLNPLQASFFSKVMGLLITRKSELILERLQAQERFLSRILFHLGTSAIMDLLLRLITTMESQEARSACISWLVEQELVKKLVQMLDPLSGDPDIHNNAAQSLCDIIRVGREQAGQLLEDNSTNPISRLLAVIELKETVSQLLDVMFKDDVTSESCLVNGLYVIQTLLEFRRTSVEVGEPQSMTLSDLSSGNGCGEAPANLVDTTGIIQALIPRLKDFHKILLHPPKQYYQPMPTTYGIVERPLGNTRLQTVRLIACILAANVPEVNTELMTLGTLGVMLDLYFEYAWNNFLHAQVEHCIRAIITCDTVDQPLLAELISEVHLLERIMDAFGTNDTTPSAVGASFPRNRCCRQRVGFMGHLTRIANSLVGGNHVKNTNTQKVNDLIQNLTEETRLNWCKFVEEVLVNVNKQNLPEAIGSSSMLSATDDDADFRSLTFPQETVTQKFGFHEDEYNEQNDVRSPFSDHAESRFALSPTATDTASAEMFERMCSAREEEGLPNFDTSDPTNDDLWEEKECTIAAGCSLPTFTTTSTSLSSGLATTIKSGPKTQNMVLGDPDSDEEDKAENSAKMANSSSDSEEDLDSPLTIRQAPEVEHDFRKTAIRNMVSSSEEMDVSSSDDWAKFDDVPMDINPVIDQSSSSWWGGTSIPPSTSSSSTAASTEKASSENWANFGSSFPPNDPVTSANSWANFSDIGETSAPSDNSDNIASNIGSTASSVPATGRSAAYLIGSTDPVESSSLPVSSQSTDFMTTQEVSCGSLPTFSADRICGEEAESKYTVLSSDVVDTKPS